MDADGWNRRYAEKELVWSAGPNRFLAAEAADLAPGRALDLACGEGRNALWLAEQGWRVTAVDFSGVAVEKGLFERRKAEKQKAHEEDQRALDSGEESREDLHRENSLFYGVQVRIRWDKAEHLC